MKIPTRLLTKDDETIDFIFQLGTCTFNKNSIGQKVIIAKTQYNQKC